MTDLEISKALALAIGWDEAKEFSWGVMCHQRGQHWYNFDYRDWNVVGPIAERYDLFPQRYRDMWVAGGLFEDFAREDTPQKAIALAVIGAKK